MEMATGKHSEKVVNIEFLCIAQSGRKARDLVKEEEGWKDWLTVLLNTTSV